MFYIGFYEWKGSRLVNINDQEYVRRDYDVQETSYSMTASRASLDSVIVHS